MNSPDEETPIERPEGAPRLRFELIFASVLLAFGFFVLPALIYLVGASVLGPYGENAGIGVFYEDFYRDLAAPSGRAWMLAVGPLAVIYLIRLVFVGVRARAQQPEPSLERESAPVETAPEPIPQNRRVEPRVTLE